MNRSLETILLYAAVLRRAIGPLIVFVVTLDVAVTLLLDPLLLVLLESIVSLSGDPFVGNTALITFVRSPIGMASFITAGIGLILVNLLAFGGISLVLWNARQRRPVRQLAIWYTLVTRLPSLLAISVFVVGAALLLAIPIVAVAFAAWHWWLSSGDPYFYISTLPPEFIRTVAATGAATAICALAGLYLLLRFGLALPLCLLRPLGATRALRRAGQASHRSARRLMPRLVAVAIGLVLLWILALAGLSHLLRWLLVQPLVDIRFHLASAAFVIVAAVTFAALNGVSRAGLVLVLIADPAAGEVLPSRELVPGKPSYRLARLRVMVMLLFCAAIPVATLVEAARASNLISPDHAIAITAHRAGSARAPENTLAALRTAIAEGADVVEIDVQETADGQVVLLHDTDLRRVAGVARPIWDMRLDELKDLDAGSWFSPNFHTERIPTLAAFAAAARGHVHLNVELKKNLRTEDLAARVVAALRDTGTNDQTEISSLDLGLLRDVRRIAPDIKRGLILATGLGDLRRVDVDFFALSRRLATPAVIRQLHAIGRKVHVWTLDDEASIARAMLDGADNIITSDTLLGVKVRKWFDGLTAPERILLRIGRPLKTSVSANQGEED